jgi:hypothetical protein
MFPNMPRPPQLSNQNCCYSHEQMAVIDSKPLESLTWSDFEAIFALSQCTAQFQEQLYYFPFALQYLQAKPDEGNELLPGLVYFTASHREALDRAGFLAPALAALRGCFTIWTSAFQIRHFDKIACAQKGWQVDHSDYVEHSAAVRELIDVLLRYGLAPLAEDLVESWVSVGSRPEDSAWLLEFAKEEREAYEYYCHERTVPPDVDMTPSKRSKRIVALITDNVRLQAEYDRISENLVANEQSPTYWADLTSSLGITA